MVVFVGMGEQTCGVISEERLLNAAVDILFREPGPASPLSVAKLVEPELAAWWCPLDELDASGLEWPGSTVVLGPAEDDLTE